MIGKLYCYLIRLFGGEHKFMRTTIAEQTQRRSEGKPMIKRCSRCGTERVIKTREAK